MPGKSLGNGEFFHELQWKSREMNATDGWKSTRITRDAFSPTIGPISIVTNNVYSADSSSRDTSKYLLQVTPGITGIMRLSWNGQSRDVHSTEHIRSWPISGKDYSKGSNKNGGETCGNAREESEESRNNTRRERQLARDCRPMTMRRVWHSSWMGKVDGWMGGWIDGLMDRREGARARARGFWLLARRTRLLRSSN